MNAPLLAVAGNWEAKLDLEFEKRRQRTVLAKNWHKGPLVVQKPFYPEQDVCHAYLLHPPGGVVGGDHLDINVTVKQNAHALITTPASGKFYRSNGLNAIQNQNIEVDNNAILEWLPQDTILFSGSRVRTKTQITLKQDSHFIGWEIICLGRPASGESFSDGFCRQSFELWRENSPLLIERTKFEGGSNVLNAAWGMASYTSVGIMVVTNANKETLSLARQVMAEEKNLYSATLMGELLVCRMLGHQGMQLREHFTNIWMQIRKQVIGKKATVPRIWNT